MSCEDRGSRSRRLLRGGVRRVAVSCRMQQLGEMVLAVTVATLGVRGVHRLEVGSDQRLVPDEGAGLHVRGDRSDPLDLGHRERQRVFELEQDEPGESEVVLGHLERGIESCDSCSEADDPACECSLGPLLGDVAEETDRDPEDRGLVDRGREEIGEPVLELLTPFRRDAVDRALRSPALAAGLDRLDVTRRLQVLDGPVEGAGLAHRVRLVAVSEEALDLVGMAGLLAEQAEGGQRHHVLGLSAHLHIALRTIAPRIPSANEGRQSSGCRATSWCSWRYSRIAMSAAMPSPTADPSCLVELRRTSPAAKTPGIDVVNPPLSSTKPRASRSTLPRRNAVLGSSPMKTKAARGVTTCSSPVARSRRRTDSSFPLPVSSTTSVLRCTTKRGSLLTLSWRRRDAVSSGSRCTTRMRLANLVRNRPSSSAEFPPPMTRSSSAPR